MEITKIEHLDLSNRRVLREITLVTRIDAFLEDQNIQPMDFDATIHFGGTRRKGVFHASTIGDKSGKSLCGKYPMACGRKLYYGAINAESEETLSPRVRRIFDTGTAIHAQLQAYLATIAAANGDTFIPEAIIDPDENEVADRYDISGHTDGIYQITLPDLVVRFGLEIKTINDAGFKITSSAHGEHVTQGTIYQKCLDLPVMLFLYYNKNNSSMVEFAVPFQKQRWVAIAEKLDVVRKAVLRDDPPARENGYHCSECKYRKICNPPRRHSRGPFGRARV
jgi:hypothetical protein